MADYTEKIVWHEVITRPPTEEEKKEYKRMTGEDAAYAYDCKMPEDGEEILVKGEWGVGADTCHCLADVDPYLETCGWEDVLAWAEMPKGSKEDTP